jgi:HlyD family secretion protein
MSIFRKSALDRLSSPEQLDKLVQITSPRSWMTLAFFILIILATVAWSLLGSIPTTIQAQGVLMSSNGVDSHFSTLGGTISDVTIAKDDFVHVGQTIARISRDDYVAELGRVEARIARVTAFTLDSALNAEQMTDDLLNLFGIRKQIVDMDQQIEKYRISDTTQQILDNIRQYNILVAQGKAAVTAGVPGAEAALAQAQQNLASLKSQYSQTKEAFDGNLSYLLFQKSTLEDNFTATRSAQLDTLAKRSLELKNVVVDSEIKSSFEGQVLEVDVAKGNVVQAGQVLATSMKTGSDAYGTGIVLYIAIENGKKLVPGMEINVYPTTVNRQEYGHMVAVVTRVSEYAVSVADMRAKLGNDELISLFLKAGVLLEVDASLVKDAGTRSGYYWSSRKAKELVVQDGTLCNASIVTEENKPISLLFPILKEKLLPFD